MLTFTEGDQSMHNAGKKKKDKGNKPGKGKVPYGGLPQRGERVRKHREVRYG